MTMEQRCDGVVDCRDKSDEARKSFVEFMSMIDVTVVIRMSSRSQLGWVQ